MQYLGGKQRLGKRLAAVLQPYITDTYMEPFVGGAGVIQHIDAKYRYGLDANHALIALWKALQNGWEPPEHLSEDEYRRLKEAKDPNDPMTAFAGFGCSFGGKWFGGFARNAENHNYAKSTKNALLKQIPKLADVYFITRDYRDIKPFCGAVVYCDPPYANTTAYGALPNFDHDEFWETVRRWERGGVKVFTSEYVAPDDFEAVWQSNHKTGLRDKTGNVAKRVEKLFRWKGGQEWP